MSEVTRTDNSVSSAAAPTDTSIYGVLDRALQKAEVAAAVVGGIMMLSAMFLTSADALMRYFFDEPLTFNFYLTEKYLLVALITMPMAWGFRTGGFIRITALVQSLPRGPGILLLRSGLLVSFVYIAVLAWLGGIHFLEVYRRGDVQMGVIDWPVSWSWIWIPVGLGLLACRLFLSAVGPAGHIRFVRLEGKPEEDTV